MNGFYKYEKYEFVYTSNRMERSSCEDCFYGSVTVGERGQVVIPAEARTFLGIKPGDKLLVMKDPFHKGVMLARFEDLKGFLGEFGNQMESARERDLGE